MYHDGDDVRSYVYVNICLYTSNYIDKALNLLVDKQLDEFVHPIFKQIIDIQIGTYYSILLPNLLLYFCMTQKVYPMIVKVLLFLAKSNLMIGD